MESGLARPVLDKGVIAGGPCFFQLGLGGIQAFYITCMMDIMMQL